MLKSKWEFYYEMLLKVKEEREKWEPNVPEWLLEKEREYTRRWEAAMGSVE